MKGLNISNNQVRYLIFCTSILFALAVLSKNVAAKKLITPEDFNWLAESSQDFLHTYKEAQNVMDYEDPWLLFKVDTYQSITKNFIAPIPAKFILLIQQTAG